MNFLLDENTPRSLGSVFEKRGFLVEFVRDIDSLRGKSDDVIFNHGVENNAIIVTRDIDFANPLRFGLHRLPGLIILRFPNEISVEGLCREVARLTSEFQEEDFHNLIIIEPGFVRIRDLRA